MEPTSSAASGYIISKGAAALAALVGGLSVSFFYQPKKLHEHGKLVAGAIIGAIAVGAAFATGGLIAIHLGLNFEDIDIALGIGYLIGIMSVGLIAWIANFLEKREEKDLLEVIKEIRGNEPNLTKKPAVKKTAKKPVKKTPAKKAAK